MSTDTPANSDSAPLPDDPQPDAARSGRIRIGSQREPAELPAAAPPPRPAPKPAANLELKKSPTERPARKVPPPNLRGQLTPELEVEFAQALAGASLEALLADPQLAAGGVELEPETRCRGQVVAVRRDQVFLDLGGRRQGVLPLAVLPEPPAAGTVLDVVVSRHKPDEGLYELILPGGAVDVGDWSQVHEGMVVEARVTGHNKGGLECDVSRLRGFIPAGQASLYRVEDLAEFVGQKLLCVVTEANPEKRNLVLSHRAVLERERAESKARLLAALEVGQTREGIVRSLQPFGAFVDLGGVDGLIHISQLSWDRVQHASEVLELGQKVTVKIQRIDPETGKISLGFRDLAENPWTDTARKYPVRARVRGLVTRIAEYGAFVKLEPGVEGLVHVSELSHKRVWRPGEVVSEGQEVEVQVLSVDPEQQRISLSLKALEVRAESAPEDPAAEADAPPDPPPARRSQAPLKGGLGGPSGGDRFGLKW
jgi:small subunit ribosomal protein S1